MSHPETGRHDHGHPHDQDHHHDHEHDHRPRSRSRPRPAGPAAPPAAPAFARARRPGRRGPRSQRRGHANAVDLARRARGDRVHPGGRDGGVRVGRAARRHAAQRRRRADRGAARDRVRARPPPADPPLYLRLRAGRGPGRDRDRADHRGVLGAGRLRGVQPAAAPSARVRPGRGRRRGARRLRGQRAGGQVPDPHRPEDRLGGADRRRPARPHRRADLAGRAASGRAASRSAGTGPTRSSACSSPWPSCRCCARRPARSTGG